MVATDADVVDVLAGWDLAGILIRDTEGTALGFSGGEVSNCEGADSLSGEENDDGRGLHFGDGRRIFDCSGIGSVDEG